MGEHVEVSLKFFLNMINWCIPFENIITCSHRIIVDLLFENSAIVVCTIMHQSILEVLFLKEKNYKPL